MMKEGLEGRYVEVHMEQGPVLETMGVPLGPVSAIAGQTRLAVQVHGVQVMLSSSLDPAPVMSVFMRIIFNPDNWKQ